MFQPDAFASPFLVNAAMILIAAMAFAPLDGGIRTAAGRQLALGGLFGVLAVGCMAVPFQITDGAQADLRYAAVMLAGPYGGPIALLVASGIAGAYRLGIGGYGALFGVGLIAASAVLGLALWRFMGSLDTKRKAILAGLALPVSILIPSLLLAIEFYGIAMVAAIALAYLIANPVAILLFSLLANGQRQQRASKAALVDAEHRLNQIMEIAYDWFWVTDADLRFTAFSSSIHRALDTKELIGRRRDELTPGPLSEPMRQHIADMEQRRPFRNFVYPLPRRNGVVSHISVSGLPHYDAEGRFTGYIGSGRDITEEVEKDAALTRAREAAEAANQAKSAFLANMSHEIRTPMTGMLGMLDLLDSTPLDAEQKDYVEKARASSATLTAIVNDVLDLSKIEAGRMRIESAPFDLRRALTAACEAQAVAARAKGLTFSLQIAPDLGATAIGDCHRITQILTNLLSNAVRFTEHGGITVAASATAEGIAIAVADTGTGIRPDTLKRIFDPFEQADVSTTRRYGGTGLGLAICKSLCERMSGAITATSTFGTGSTFTVSLPLRFIEGTDAQPLAETAPRRPSAGVRLLVAEDNAINALLLQRMLTHRGHQVTVVANGKLAVEAVAEGDFDAVLLDMHMPVLDGREATKRIRALPDARGRIPVFALTADALQQNRGHYDDIGLTEFLTKPVDWDGLDNAIMRHVPAPTELPAEDSAAKDDGSDAPRTESRDGSVTNGEPPVVDEDRLHTIETALGAQTFADLVAAFEPATRQALSWLEDCIARRDIAGQRAALHELRGQAANLGATRLAAEVGAIERASLETAVDIDAVRSLHRTADATYAALAPRRKVA